MEAEKTEALEAEIDRLIERRANERRDANHVEELWKEPTGKHNEQRRRENGAAWYAHHMTLCDAHRELAEAHEEAARKLLEMPETVE